MGDPLKPDIPARIIAQPPNMVCANYVTGDAQRLWNGNALPTTMMCRALAPKPHGFLKCCNLYAGHSGPHVGWAARHIMWWPAVTSPLTQVKQLAALDG